VVLLEFGSAGGEGQLLQFHHIAEPADHEEVLGFDGLHVEEAESAESGCVEF
jgi:hypothetical protein